MGSIVEMHGISKAFGTNQANNNIDFVCERGEVVCLLGENGAGKSTLMKILYGMYRPDSGTIKIGGNEVKLSGAQDAIMRGIQMVHQHFMLVPTMSVTDNVMIGKEIKTRGLYNRKKAAEQVKELVRRYGLKVPENKMIGELSVGEQQRVEIIKALYHGAEVLILDEPTAVLTHQEVEELFTVVRRLRDNGKTIILITHKLKETIAISNRVYVMRTGEMVAVRNTVETNIEELGYLMVGKKVEKVKKTPCVSEKNILKMKNVTLKNKYGYPVLQNLALDIREQEILGIAGVEGNGQTELIEVLMALNTKWEGQVTLDGISIKGENTEKLLEKGVSCIHADRQEYSIAMEMDVPNNMLIGYQNAPEFHKGKYILNWKGIKAETRKMMEEYDVRPRDIERNLSEFSGGNQQKFVVAREMRRHPKFMIAAHPTRGVDIMATAFIHDKLNQMKSEGAAILLISSDMDELMTLSDRIAVIYDGTIAACRKPEEYTAAEIGRLMGGGKSNEKKSEN